MSKDSTDALKYALAGLLGVGVDKGSEDGDETKLAIHDGGFIFPVDLPTHWKHDAVNTVAIGRLEFGLYVFVHEDYAPELYTLRTKSFETVQIDELGFIHRLH